MARAIKSFLNSDLIRGPPLRIQPDLWTAEKLTVPEEAGLHWIAV